MNFIPFFIVLITYCSPYNDIQTPLVELLQSTKKQCLVAAYTINSPVLVNTLIALHKRGVDVEVITDSTQAAGAHERQALDVMYETGIPIFVGKSACHQIMHVKMCIIDGDRVAYGSYNWTDVANKQDNTLTIDDDPRLVMRLTKFWQQIKQDLR